MYSDPTYFEHLKKLKKYSEEGRVDNAINECNILLELVINKQKAEGRRLHKGNEFFMLGSLFFSRGDRINGLKYLLCAYIEDILSKSEMAPAREILSRSGIGSQAFEIIKTRVNAAFDKGYLIINPEPTVKEALDTLFGFQITSSEVPEINYLREMSKNIKWLMDQSQRHDQKTEIILEEIKDKIEISSLWLEESLESLEKIIKSKFESTWEKIKGDWEEYRRGNISFQIFIGRLLKKGGKAFVNKIGIKIPIE